MSCHLITPIKCLKDHKSPGLLLNPNGCRWHSLATLGTLISKYEPLVKGLLSSFGTTPSIIGNNTARIFELVDIKLPDYFSDFSESLTKGSYKSRHLCPMEGLHWATGRGYRQGWGWTKMRKLGAILEEAHPQRHGHPAGLEDVHRVSQQLHENERRQWRPSTGTLCWTLWPRYTELSTPSSLIYMSLAQLYGVLIHIHIWRQERHTFSPMQSLLFPFLWQYK